MTPEISIPGVDLPSIAPELILAAGGLLVLVAGAAARPRHSPLLSAVSILVFTAAAAAALLFSGPDRAAFDGVIARDGFATFFKVVLASVGIVGVLASQHYLTSEEAPATEYLGLMIFGTAGMMLMASASDLVFVFVALETFSLALYVMAAFRRSRLESQEGALKYFLTGSFSSAFFLYGVALIYGGTGSTRFSEIAEAAAGEPISTPLLLAGVALVLVGLAFKVAAVPFHMWTPDAYQGSPAPVSGFMAAGSKVAGFAVLLRLLVSTLPELIRDWQPVIIGLALASMITGSVVAVVQGNVKRMLAYSSIAHTGFLLTGVAAASDRGVSGSLFYLAVYTFVIIGAFAVVYGARGEERADLADYRGLWSRRPFLAGSLALLLVSLAGVPPTAGFWAKFEVFSAAADAGLYVPVVVAVITSAIAAFFYLRVIVLMFLEEPAEWAGRTEGTFGATGAALLVTSALVLILGVYPTPLIDFARAATLLR